jgi:hypothetical protein
MTVNYRSAFPLDQRCELEIFRHSIDVYTWLHSISGIRWPVNLAFGCGTVETCSLGRKLYVGSL